MEYNFSQNKEPLYSLNNQKFQKKIYINKTNNKTNNKNNNSIIKEKIIKSFHREIISNEKNNQKNFKTTKNSPDKNIKFYRYFKENKNIKIDLDNELIKNNNNEVFNDFFTNKMKRIHSKKFNQNQNIIKPNSNSLIMNQNNINSYKSNKICFNINDKRYELSMNGSRIIKDNKMSYNNNSNFYYNHNLLNYYNNSFEENEFKNNGNKPNKKMLINKNEFLNKKVNYSNSMRMIFPKKNENNLLNKYNNMNNNNFNNNFYFNGEIKNDLEKEKDFSNKINLCDKNKYASNCNLIKNSEKKLYKNYINNRNFNINYNCNNNLNYNINSKDNYKNRIYAHYRVKSNEESNNKIKIIPEISNLNNLKYKKDNPKYIIKFDSQQNNNSKKNMINQKLNNILDYCEIKGLNSELSKMDQTSRLNSNDNIIKKEYYHELNNNDLNNLENNIYNSNRQLNSLIKSLEGYIHMNQVKNIINNDKELQNNISNKNIYKNNMNSSLKINNKENFNDNNSLCNETERKRKLNNKLTNSYINQEQHKQIKEHCDKGGKVVRSSSSNNQKTTQYSSLSKIYNMKKNIKKMIKNNNNKKLNNFENINNNISNNMSNNISNNNTNLNNFSLLKSNNFHTINDKKNLTSNNFMIKDYKSKDKYKLSNNNSISNNISSNNNSINNLGLGKDLIYQKKISPKDIIYFSTIQNNNKPFSKIGKKFFNNISSSFKLENIKTNLIKNIPLTKSQSPTDKKEIKYFSNFNIQNNRNKSNNEKYNNNIKESKKYAQYQTNENNRNDKVKIYNEKKINNNDIHINKIDNNSEMISSTKTNEFENRNISEFPINDNIIKRKIEKHNNLYMNKNNIMALNEKNKEIEEKKEDNIILNNIDNKSSVGQEEDKKNENNKSKLSINTKETKEIFKSIHDSDTLIDKENHLPQLNTKNIPNVIEKNKFLDKKDNLDFIKEIKIKDIKFIKSNIDTQDELNKGEELIIKEIKKNKIIEEKEKNIELKNEKENKNYNDNKKDIINNNFDEKYKENDKGKSDKKDNIDLNFIQNKIIFDEKNIEFNNNYLVEQKKQKELGNINDSLGNKNQRGMYKINQKINTKEKKYNLIKNMYKQDMLCEPINAKNPKNLNSNINNSKNNIFTTTVTKDCEFYQNEQEKLSKYIKNFYQTNKKYPRSDINFYLYGRQIGHGAFGKVNIALHIASGRLVAIKIFSKKNLKNTRAKQKIKNEIEMLSHFHHPFINQILDNFETDTHIFIIMEYVCGDLLGFIRKRGKLSESVSKLIFKQLIEGLKYIHKKKVVHRDIKLDNILIDLTNTIKICDFGVSRYYTKDELMFEHCGTPAYISPEIFENKGYKGTGCDIWSAGVTLYYMLGGVQPFKANSIKELEKNIKKGDFKPLEEVSSEANNLIKGMLQVNPKKRLTVDEILNHPWLSKVDLNQRQKLNLFTEAEKVLMSKFDVNYLNSDKSELIENFTLKNIEDENNKNSSKNGYTKSIIFAPYNSYIESNTNTNEDNLEKKINIDLHFEEEEIYNEIKVMNDICKFGWRAQQANIQYELSNNGDFDNGLIKTQKEEDFKKENEKIEKLYKNNIKYEKKELLNNSKSSSSEDEMNEFESNANILEKIEKEIGYDKKYIIECIKKNKVNYATGTYYLLIKEKEYNYDFNINKNSKV